MILESSTVRCTSIRFLGHFRTKQASQNETAPFTLASSRSSFSGVEVALLEDRRVSKGNPDCDQENGRVGGLPTACRLVWSRAAL
jgi:hypothetical protein